MNYNILPNSIIDIKKNNFTTYISQLETVKSHHNLCKKAVEEYDEDLTAQKEWLIKHFELGLLFEEIFDLGFFFNNEESSKSDDLLLLDNSVYGFKINASRDDFEYEIKFKKVFENLFFEKKLFPEKLAEYKKDFETEFPF